MLALKVAFMYASLVDTVFQFLPAGVPYGHTVSLLGYPAGSMPMGGSNGLVYFLAVGITLPIAQVANSFA